jgi:hypothetical protein
VILTSKVLGLSARWDSHSDTILSFRVLSCFHHPPRIPIHGMVLSITGMFRVIASDSKLGDRHRESSWRLSNYHVWSVPTKRESTKLVPWPLAGTVDADRRAGPRLSCPGKRYDSRGSHFCAVSGLLSRTVWLLL